MKPFTQSFFACAITLVVPVAWGAGFNFSNDVEIERHPELRFKIETTLLPDSCTMGHAHLLMTPVELSQKPPPAIIQTSEIIKNTFTTKGNLNNKDGTTVGSWITQYQNIDGVSSLVKIEVTYLMDTPVGPFHKFIFPLKKTPSNSPTCEVYPVTGLAKNFDLKTQEIPSLKQVRKITLTKDPLHAIIEPGKNCDLEIWDSRIADLKDERIEVMAASKKAGPFKKGEKVSFEIKCSFISANSSLLAGEREIEPVPAPVEPEPPPPPPTGNNG